MGPIIPGRPPLCLRLARGPDRTVRNGISVNHLFARLFRIGLLAILSLSLRAGTYTGLVEVNRGDDLDRSTSRRLPQHVGESSSPGHTRVCFPLVMVERLPTRVPVYGYIVANVFRHDRRAFTQGLVFENGVLYEGTGLYGESTLRRVELETGDVLQQYDLPDRFFGEGLAIYGDRIIQLTWQAHVGFVYDKDSFELLQEFGYPTEGWGLTHDGERLIMSDGSSTLYFLDPATYEEIGRIQVRDEDGPVTRLNELEYIQGEVYANVWPTERIARVSPQTGRVIGWIDLTGILAPEDRNAPIDVLNGIAYDAENDRLFVTGKWWPKLYEIELREGE